MRIGMLADIYKPYVSGVTSYISHSKRYLEGIGHEVMVFTFGNQHYQDEETNVYRAPGIPTFFEGYYFGFIYPPEIRQILQSMDVVHVHHPLISGRLALRYCRPLGIPIIYTNHTRYDTYADVFVSGPAHQASLDIMKTYMEDFYNKVDLVVVPSETTKTDLKKFGLPESAEVVPHGLDLTLFNIQASAIPRQDIGFTSEDILVVYVGRLGAEKNLPFLLHAFQIAQQSMPQLGLMLVGDGPARRNLENLANELDISKRARFVGTIPHAELPGYYRVGDIFASTSPKEAFGFTVVEAMACNLPVIALDTAWTRELIQPDVSGYLCPDDLDEFGRRLVEMANNPMMRQRMGYNAQNASRKFTLAQSMDTMVSLYQRLLHARPEPD